MFKNIALFNRKPKEGPQKCPVYLKLPWIGKISLNFEKQTKIAINRCHHAVEPRIIFTTRKILPAIHKDVLSSLQQSMVVYQYVCCCDCGGGGGTTRPLPRDGGAEELRGDPTVGKSRIEREEPKIDLRRGSEAGQSRRR